MPETEIDTFNKFFVGAHGDSLVFLKPIPTRLSHDDALLLAAFLVSMVGDDEQWERVLKAVQNG